MEKKLIRDIESTFESLRNARILALDSDERILQFLLEGSKFKDEFQKRFFENKFGITIFKKDDFINFLDLRLLSGSFTSFSNKIGLGSQARKFIKNSDLVVLNFPFKDCILKGGQRSDDEKSTELFFNNILAKSEIDLLLVPKILKNFEFYGGGGGSQARFSRLP